MEGFLAATIVASTPLLFATLGEIITEKSGLLNLGVEGLMLMGAIMGFVAGYETGNPWIGVLGAALAGAYYIRHRLRKFYRQVICRDESTRPD